MSAFAKSRRRELEFVIDCSYLAQRAAPLRKRADGQQEVGGVRRIASSGDELRDALRRDKAGVAVLPSLELVIEEGAPRRVVGKGRQVRIHAGDEAAGAIYAAASFGFRGDMISVFRCHPAPDSLQRPFGR